MSKLVSFPQAIYPPHLALLIRIGDDAAHVGPLVLDDRVHKVVLVLWLDILAQFGQESRGPLVLHVRRLCVELALTALFLTQRHLVVVRFVVLALLGLQIRSV